MPVVVHARDAFEETLAVVQDYADVTYYFHCWGYGHEEVEVLLESLPDVYIGFCGNVTYKNATVLRESLQVVPIDRLLLETDAPYLAPQIVR